MENRPSKTSDKENKCRTKSQEGLGLFVHGGPLVALKGNLERKTPFGGSRKKGHTQASKSSGTRIQIARTPPVAHSQSQLSLLWGCLTTVDAPQNMWGWVKNRYPKWLAMVSGNMDENLRLPVGLILTHTHVGFLWFALNELNKGRPSKQDTPRFMARRSETSFAGSQTCHFQRGTTDRRTRADGCTARTLAKGTGIGRLI